MQVIHDILDYNSARSEFIVSRLLLFVFKCMIILVGYPLAIPSISDLTDQSEEQRETRLLLIRLFFSVYSLN